MVQVKKYIEKGLWLLLALSPALDIVNGIWAYLLSGGTGGMLSSLNIKNLPTLSPSLAVRLVFLLMMTVYLLILKKHKSVLMFFSIGCTWFLTVLYEFLRGVEFSLMADIQYIVRFCYCLVVLVAYTAMLKEDGRNPREIKAAVDKVLCWSLLVLGVGVLVPYLLGMGFYTYADPLGYRGSRGFFYAGNDITAVMMLVLPVVLAGWMEQKNWKKPGYGWVQAAACAFCFMSMLIIGTKTAFLAAGVTAVAMGCYALYQGLSRKQWDMLAKLIIVGLLVAGLMLTLSLGTALVQQVKTALSGSDAPKPVAPNQSGSPLDTIKDSISATNKYNETAGVETVLFSGRTGKLRNVLAQIKDALPFSALVGLGRGSQQRIIEMDLFEVVFYYGALGTVTMLWLYLLQGVKVVVDLFRNFSLCNLAVCVALALCVGFLALAGHTLFSVTGGYYFAFMIVYARLFCSKEGMEAEIL